MTGGSLHLNISKLRNHLMNESNTKDGIRLGLRTGPVVACIYACVLGLFWTISETTAEVSWVERLLGFIWFLLYGCIVGSILGAVVGVITGYLLAYLLERLVPNTVSHAWLVGLLFCTCLWLASLVIGYYLLVDPDRSSETYRLYLGLIVYPGVFYILSGAWFAQKFWQIHKVRNI